MRRAVLVNGVPASGKSTVARRVAAEFVWPLLTLDAIKEPFFEHVGVGDREHNRRLGRASYHAIFNLIADFPDGCVPVIDAWFGFQPLDVLQGHLARARIDAAVELWCHAEPEVVGARYAARVEGRPPGHPGLDYVPELVALARRARPLGAYPCLALDTGAALDAPALFAWLAQAWGQR